MKRLIVTYLWCRNGFRDYDAAVLDLWHRSLRGPGQHDGDVLVVTNEEDLGFPDIETVTIPMTYSRPAEFFHSRVFNHTLVPHDRYDAIIQMDTDMLAVAPLQELFAERESMRVSASGMRALDPAHIRRVLNPAKRLLYNILPRTRNLRGVSACLFSTLGETWPRHMETWARLIRTAEASHRTPPHSDQGILNFALLERSLPLEPYAPEVILHRDWCMKPQTRIWHFPGLENRAGLMREHLDRILMSGSRPHDFGASR